MIHSQYIAVAMAATAVPATVSATADPSQYWVEAQPPEVAGTVYLFPDCVAPVILVPIEVTRYGRSAG